MGLRPHLPPRPPYSPHPPPPLSFHFQVLDTPHITSLPPCPVHCVWGEPRTAGVVCVVRADADGSHEVVHAVGNVAQWVYLRSAIKYIQVLPLVESGAIEHFGFTVGEPG